MVRTLSQSESCIVDIDMDIAKLLFTHFYAHVKELVYVTLLVLSY